MRRAVVVVPQGVESAGASTQDQGSLARDGEQERRGIAGMSDLLISVFVFAIIFGGALLGMFVRPLLSEQHLQPDSKDVVKMATGLIGTLAALVLGLLIASAKSSFDEKTS